MTECAWLARLVASEMIVDGDVDGLDNDLDPDDDHDGFGDALLGVPQELLLEPQDLPDVSRARGDVFRDLCERNRGIPEDARNVRHDTVDLLPDGPHADGDVALPAQRDRERAYWPAENPLFLEDLDHLTAEPDHRTVGDDHLHDWDEHLPPEQDRVLRRDEVRGRTLPALRGLGARGRKPGEGDLPVLLRHGAVLLRCVSREHERDGDRNGAEGDGRIVGEP